MNRIAPAPRRSDSFDVGFNVSRDALNLSDHCIQRSDDWLILNNLNVAERYIEGSIHAVIHFRAEAEPHEFDLVCRREPLAVPDFRVSGDGSTTHADVISKGDKPNWDDHAMRIGVPKLIKAANKFIRSRIWLEASKQRFDFRRDILKFPAGEFALQMCGVVGEGEHGFFGLDPAQSNSACVDGMIEGVSKVADRILGDGREPRWKLSRQPDFVDFLSRFMIEIDDSGIWASLEKSLDPFVQFANVLPCACE